MHWNKSLRFQAIFVLVYSRLNLFWKQNTPFVLLDQGSFRGIAVEIAIGPEPVYFVTDFIRGCHEHKRPKVTMYSLYSSNPINYTFA